MIQLIQTLINEIASLRTKLTTEQTQVATLQSNVDKAKAALNAALTVQEQQQASQAMASYAATATATRNVLRRALLVGINYTDTPNMLGGCINDVVNIKTYLENSGIAQLGVTEFRMLTDDTSVKPSRAAVIEGLRWLSGGLQSGENVYFHYSGHGGQLRDTSGDEASGFDSCIFPWSPSGGIERISDDELRAELAVNVPEGSKCFVVLDACHSGSGVDLRYTWQAPSATSLSYTEAPKYDKTRGEVLFLSACRDEQTAADTADGSGSAAGALTWALLETWKTYGKSIKTKHLLWDVRQFLRTRSYPQVPQLSTGRYTDLNQEFVLG